MLNNWQRDPRWGNLKLGFSNTLIKDYGCTISAIGNVVNVTPDVVNERLKAVNGFAQGNLVIWSKIAEAFPNFTVTRKYGYDNADVLKNIPNVILEVSAGVIGSPNSKHWIQYIGNGKCNDPWTGQVKATSYFGMPSGYALITPKNNPQPTPEPQPPTGGGLTMDFLNKGDNNAWKYVIGKMYDKNPDVVAIEEVSNAKGSNLTPIDWLHADWQARKVNEYIEEAKKPLNEQISQLNNQLDTAKEHIKDLDGTIVSKQGTITTLLSQLEQVANQLNTTNTIEDIIKAIKDLQAVETRILDMEKKYKKYRDLIEEKTNIAITNEETENNAFNAIKALVKPGTDKKVLYDIPLGKFRIKIYKNV